MIQSHWDSIVHKGRSDPKLAGLADVSFKIIISTLGNGKHTVNMTITNRPVKDSASVTPSDAELEDEEFEEDPASGTM